MKTMFKLKRKNVKQNNKKDCNYYTVHLEEEGLSGAERMLVATYRKDPSKIAVISGPLNYGFSPKLKERYFYLLSTGEVKETVNNSSHIDKKLIMSGNCFMTRNSAMRAKDFLKEFFIGDRL